MFKRKVPFLLGITVVLLLLVGALAAAVLLLETRPPETQILAAAQRYLRERYERLGHPISADTAPLTILHHDRTDAYVQAAVLPVQRSHLLHLARQEAWTVRADLFEHFERYLADKQVIQEVPNRMKARLERLYGVEVKLTDLQYTTDLRFADATVFGIVQVPYRQQNTSCLYQESHVYRNGTWTREGEGQVFEEPPRRAKP